MINSFSENSIYWILGTALIALALTIFGLVTGKTLPPKQRKLHVRRYALIGFAIVCFGLPIFRPFVSSYTSVQLLEEIKAENLGSVEDLAKFEKEQTRNIEKLKAEVIELKEDVYRMNLYYSSIVQFLSTILAVAALNFAFKKEEKETDED